ncbi:helix-turn-helix transcriptional regulator [Inconstantimicrobium mannanitabidum]|uniref:Transcriptional regulator n=1 Tax=Inconstantimicrobium mannanitabidum TaxID=1604901 RepID=A0ACB5RHH2_9CLOT|nr:YafY family protein [Clostridium sp. TW13]GKX68511.1 transcriptional regulator [Clostridium sp. TW13]
MRVHRMISILLLIESKGKVKAKELAEELETSVRTIYRDVDELCEAGIPLTTDTGPNGGIHFIEGYTVGIKNLHGEDIINLYLNGMGIKADRQSDMAMKVNTALLKLQKNLSSELNNDLNTIRKRFYVDDIPWWGEEHKLCNIDMILQGVWQSQKLRITYEKHRGEMTQRDISPYGIVVNEMNWYMIAYCEKGNDIRTFKCERITECQCLNEKFIIPVNFSVKEFWKKSKQSFISECSKSEKYPVVIRIDKHRTDILKNFEVYKIEEAENHMDVTVNMFKYEFAVNDVLGIIGYIEVLNPPELRSYVQQELINIMDRYK